MYYQENVFHTRRKYYKIYIYKIYQTLTRLYHFQNFYYILQLM